jgi:hypothetical protein
MLSSRQLAAIMFTDIVGYTALITQQIYVELGQMKLINEIKRVIIYPFLHVALQEKSRKQKNYINRLSKPFLFRSFPNFFM